MYRNDPSAAARRRRLSPETRRNKSSTSSSNVESTGWSLKRGINCKFGAVRALISPGGCVEVSKHRLYVVSTGCAPLPSYQKVTPFQLPPFSESQWLQRWILQHEHTHTHTHTHTQTQADTLTDGMKHWQRCERTASMKQMGAKCGNWEGKKTKHRKKTHTHTHAVSS